MSETLATFLASTPLLEEAWRVCNIANITFPGAYLVEKIGSVAYIAFSGRQMTSGSDEKCRNLVALSKEDGGVFAPLYRHSEAEEPMVHHGMLKLFFSMFPSLQIQIADLIGKVKSIVITGQCIGGTTASLSALFLLCHLLSLSVYPPMSVLCITFGSPLVGNEALHRSIRRQRWGENFCHVVSKHDIMPRLLLAEIVNHIPHIQALLQFWHCCMASPHLPVAGLSSQVSNDLKHILFHSVLKDLELLTQVDDPSESLFWPFGSYVFCCQEGAICVENVASIMKMMHLMMATGSPNQSIEDHLKYGDYVAKVSRQFLQARNFEEGIPDSSYEAGVALALQSSDLTDKEPVAVMAKECLQMAQHSDKPNLNAANLAIKLSKIVPYRAEIEWYKACCDEADDQMGYYDSFKLTGASRREGRVNINRHRLAQFWNSVIHMLENNKLPHDFDRRGKWVNASHFYKLLVEPLDIADYYRTGMHRERGHYIEHGRERRYEVFDKWWRSVPEEENKRSKFASLTQDSCFWARVEEAKECLDNVRSERDATKRQQLWHKIDNFEAYARQLINNKEVSKDVLAKNSSFSRWMEEWKEMKSQVQQITPLFPGFVDGKVVP